MVRKKTLLSLLKIISIVQTTGGCISIGLLSLLPIDSFGQKKCTNPPTVNLNGTQGSTCSVIPFTLDNNIFGGSATAVTITSNGLGTIVPESSSSSPFSFTYTPSSSEAGRSVKITVTTNNPAGSTCKAVKATYLLGINSSLQVPLIQNITQPLCNSSTGSVTLGGLPINADWIVTVNPIGMTVVGTGIETIIGDLPSGTYTFTVSLSDNCFSEPSSAVLITEQPGIPSTPEVGPITPPDCNVATGGVTLTGLPPSGSWTLTRYPGTVSTNGTGSIYMIKDLPPGIYNYTVSTAAGCVSGLSTNITIPSRPPIPTAPIIGTVIQPTIDIQTGSVTLTGLPSEGTWAVTRTPGKIVTTGTGTISTISEIAAGTYTFSVTNSSGCSSPESTALNLILPVLPEVMITDPPPVCFPATIDLTAPEIKTGSTGGLTFTYWNDVDARVALPKPDSVPDGLYYIKGTAPSGLSDIKPVTANVRQSPVAYAGPDQTLGYKFDTNLEAVLDDGESGIWHSDSANVTFSDPADPSSEVSNLSFGANVLSWIVSNGICPADTDKVIINTGELIVSTFITPNGDSKNEYFIIRGIESLGKTELTIFDRRGSLMYTTNNYDNTWNGVDYNGRPLISDTYFYVLKSTGGKSYSGYLVIKR